MPVLRTSFTSQLLDALGSDIPILSVDQSLDRCEALGLLNDPVISEHLNYDCFIRTAIQVQQCPLLCQKKGLEGILRHILVSIPQQKSTGPQEKSGTRRLQAFNELSRSNFPTNLRRVSSN